MPMESLYTKDVNFAKMKLLEILAHKPCNIYAVCGFQKFVSWTKAHVLSWERQMETLWQINFCMPNLNFLFKSMILILCLFLSNL